MCGFVEVGASQTWQRGWGLLLPSIALLMLVLSDSQLLSDQAPTAAWLPRRVSSNKKGRLFQYQKRLPDVLPIFAIFSYIPHLVSSFCLSLILVFLPPNNGSLSCHLILYPTLWPQSPIFLASFFAPTTPCLRSHGILTLVSFQVISSFLAVPVFITWNTFLRCSQLPSCSTCPITPKHWFTSCHIDP